MSSSELSNCRTVRIVGCFEQSDVSNSRMLKCRIPKCLIPKRFEPTAVGLGYSTEVTSMTEFSEEIAS